MHPISPKVHLNQELDIDEWESNKDEESTTYTDYQKKILHLTYLLKLQKSQKK